MSEPKIVRMAATGEDRPTVFVQLDDNSIWWLRDPISGWLRLPDLPLHGEVIPPVAKKVRKRRAPDVQERLRRDLAAKRK